MTEKRFTYDKPMVAFSKGGIDDNVTGETYEFTMDTVLDLLNALHEENEQLKKGVHSSYDEHKRIVNSYCDKIKELEKENEQLKSEIKDLNDVLARYEEKELKE